MIARVSLHPKFGFGTTQSGHSCSFLEPCSSAISTFLPTTGENPAAMTFSVDWQITNT